ncbi:MAG: STAS domain-containing protein [Gammaproteobacteria bacterium]|nr:STAS domain-containing protein [Gammaproteobacteria bacterium]
MKQNSIVLQECVDIRAVNELHANLLLALNGMDEIVLDSAGVARVDTAGLQLLVAFAREAQVRGLSVTLRAGSTALNEAVLASGMEAEMRSLTTLK